MNGEKIGEYRTGADGLVYVPRLAPGWYTVTELQAADGFFRDAEPRTVEVVTGKDTFIEVPNDPATSLLIIKTDAQTGRPLQGVVFDVKRIDGQFVQGSLTSGNQPGTFANSPNKTTGANGTVAGSYTTDAHGRISINHLDAGEYSVTERKALPGYELDTNVYSVTVYPGQQSTLYLENKPLAGLRIYKVDALTGAPIANVEFMVYDLNGKVVGVFYSDNNGVVDLTAVLSEGRYKIRETRAAAGYVLDDEPKTVEFVAGKVTEITWTNMPKLGQIQILKISADDNEINGFPAGTPLAGAVFEVYSYKSGNLVDRFVTGNNGKGASKPLPLGRYLVCEVQAPQYYQLNNKELDVTLEFNEQIIKLEVANKSANTGVSIKKTGNLETMPGDIIRYNITAVRNESTIPLSDFYWRDILPVDAVRLNKIVTGTYNQSLRYKILATTNKGNTIVVADNLSTTKNNVIECSNVALGLPSDEFITTFMLMFGTVKAGFSCVEQPQIYVRVLDNLQNGYQFANKCDVGGKNTYGEWIVSNSVMVTKVVRPAVTIPLPKTGQ